MKKNHKREILLARIVFAAVLVIIAAVIALLIALVSSKVRNDDAQKKAISETTEDRKASEIVVQPVTEKVTDKVTKKVTETEPAPAEKPSKWTTTKVRFREKASTDGKILATLEKGTQVEWAADAENGWTQVLYKDKTGYIKAEFLTDQKP